MGRVKRILSIIIKSYDHHDFFVCSYVLRLPASDTNVVPEIGRDIHQSTEFMISQRGKTQANTYLLHYRVFFVFSQVFHSTENLATLVFP